MDCLVTQHFNFVVKIMYCIEGDKCAVQCFLSERDLFNIFKTKFGSGKSKDEVNTAKSRSITD